MKEVYQGDPLAFLHDSLPNDRSATLYWLYHQSMKRFARKTPPIEILKGPSDDITMPELVSSYQELNKEKCKNKTIETILMQVIAPTKPLIFVGKKEAGSTDSSVSVCFLPISFFYF